MRIRLFPYQKDAVSRLKTGSILQGGVGSGKTMTSLYYYFTNICGSVINSSGSLIRMNTPTDLYIITTAKKRDSLDWEKEAANFMISPKRDASINGITMVVDSWNNIRKYTTIKGAFFIFDEQRVVGHGAWTKSFLKIVKSNDWILLSATPGDTWLDYIPVFIANGFYKNKTEFIREHVVWSSFVRFPKVDRYLGVNKLTRLKKEITVVMPDNRTTTSHVKNIIVPYDKEKYELISKKRWNIFENRPIRQISELCSSLRKVVNSDPSRLLAIRELLKIYNKLIVFYNFNYELEILRKLKNDEELVVAEYNGHKHEDIPKAKRWVYLVQYTSGAEGWNCIETNAMVFYSQNYSYRVMTQAAGRINRINTPFGNLFYYHIKSSSPIDRAISKSLIEKKTFNERAFAKKVRVEN